MVAARVPDLIELDANFLVAALKREPAVSRELEQWLGQGIMVQMSSIAWSEYLCGPLDESDLELANRLLSRIDSFTEDDARLASELFNRTGRRARSHVDCMIAAHAIRRGASLATLNFRDFTTFQKLQLKLTREL